MTHLSSHSVQDLLLTNYVDRHMYQILRQIRHNQIITKTTHMQCTFQITIVKLLICLAKRNEFCIF